MLESVDAEFSMTLAVRLPMPDSVVVAAVAFILAVPVIVDTAD